MEGDVRRSARLFIGLVGLAIMASSLRATAEIALPEGPNRALVTRACSACHDLGMVLGAGGRMREGWDSTIEDMIAFGMSITAADRRQMLDYLATYLPPPSR